MLIIIVLGFIAPSLIPFKVFTNASDFLLLYFDISILIFIVLCCSYNGA